MNVIEEEKLKKVIEEGVQKFYEKNKVNILALNDKLINSTELGATQNISAIATNKILNTAGILQENTELDKNQKWKITEKGKKYAVIPLKFTITANNENSFIVHLKEENPKWIGSFKKEFANIIEKSKKIKEENKDGK